VRDGKGFKFPKRELMRIIELREMVARDRDETPAAAYDRLMDAYLASVEAFIEANPNQEKNRESFEAFAMNAKLGRMNRREASKGDFTVFDEGRWVLFSTADHSIAPDIEVWSTGTRTAPYASPMKTQLAASCLSLVSKTLTKKVA